MLDKEFVQVIIEIAQRIFGKSVQRIGNAPKTLLVYRTKKPFSKMVSKTWEDILGQEHKIEILGDGQQYVLFAEHPDTKKPYTWVGDSLVDIDPSSIPYITAEQCQQFIEEVERAIPEDWVEIEAGHLGHTKDFSLTNDERVLLNAKPKIDISTEKLKKAVSCIDPNTQRTPWVEVGFGLFHQFDGDLTGFTIWDEWSTHGDKYLPGETEKIWDGFKADLRKGEPVTAATILHLAKEARKEKKSEEIKQRGFQLVHATDILSKLGPVDWQVKNYFEANTTGILFGDPGSYKSFIALDIGLHCALGHPWHGNDVKQGSVIYIAGEGHGGFARRLAAFQKYNNISLKEDTPLFFSQQAASLNDITSAHMVTDAIDGITKVVGNPVMIIIDTLARNFGAGDENSTSDMNVFIEHVDKYLRAKYNTTVLIVHHTGHSNKERARGSMALKGALDFEYRLEKPEKGNEFSARMICTKMKDAQQPHETWFEGKSVVVGNFEDDEMTSLVFRKTEAPIEEIPPLKGKQKACYELLKKSVIDGEGMEKKALQKMLIDAEISKNNDQARVLVNGLVSKGYFIENQGVIGVCDFFS